MKHESISYLLLSSVSRRFKYPCNYKETNIDHSLDAGPFPSKFPYVNDALDESYLSNEIKQ